MAIVTDGTFTSPAQLGKKREAFLFDRLGDAYARVINRKYLMLGSSFSEPGTLSANTITNHALRSEAFDSASWTENACTATDNVTANPHNGATTASTLLETATTAEHYLSHSYTATNVAHVYSVYALANGRNFLYLYFADAGASAYASFFNLSTGVVGSSTANCTPSITSVGGGWYRCSIVFTPAAGAATPIIQISTDGSFATLSYAGNASLGLKIWGAQIERSATLGTYLPTTTAARTSALRKTDLTDNSSSEADAFAFLLTETPPSDDLLNMGMVRFEREYGRVPKPQIDYTSEIINRPVLDDIVSGSSYFVSFDGGQTSHRFTSRVAVSSVGSITAQTVTTAATETKAAFTPDSWPAASCIIRGGSGTSVFFTTSDDAGIKTSCQVATGLVVSVFKTFDTISINVLSGTLVGFNCSDSRVRATASGVGGASASIVITRLQTSAYTDHTVAETETVNAPAMVRTLTTSTNHGGSAGEWMVAWNGSRVVGIVKPTVIGGTQSITIPCDQSPFNVGNVGITHIGFAGGAAARYVNGTKSCSVKTTQYFWYPGWSINGSTEISTGADIPVYTSALDPISWAAAIVAGTSYLVCNSTQLQEWMGPIYTVTKSEVQMSDALETVSVSA